MIAVNPTPCRILSKKPHIAGRQGDFDLVKFIQTRFRDHGLKVSTTPYDALLSYPNDQVANSVRILDADGEIVYDSVRDESDVSHLEDVVPPFNAYAPARKVEVRDSSFLAGSPLFLVISLNAELEIHINTFFRL